MAIKKIEHYRPATEAELKIDPLHINVIDYIEEVEVEDEQSGKIDPSNVDLTKLTDEQKEYLRSIINS